MPIAAHPAGCRRDGDPPDVLKARMTLSGSNGCGGPDEPVGALSHERCIGSAAGAERSGNEMRLIAGAFPIQLLVVSRLARTMGIGLPRAARCFGWFWREIGWEGLGYPVQSGRRTRCVWIRRLLRPCLHLTSGAMNVSRGVSENGNIAR